jgi:molybdopterin synthase sulfur carrier subunit
VAKLLYFAWVRQKIGKAEEDLALPDGVSDVNALIDHLVTLGEGYKAAFANRQSVRCAVNQEHTGFDTAITDKDEIAFFPPVTGGAA